MMTWIAYAALALMVFAVVAVVIDTAASACGWLYRRWRVTHRPPNPPEPDDYEEQTMHAGWFYSNDPEHDGALINRGHWRADTVSIVVTLIGLAVAALLVTWRPPSSFLEGVWAAAAVWLMWIATDRAQAWVWRWARERRPSIPGTPAP